MNTPTWNFRSQTAAEISREDHPEQYFGPDGVVRLVREAIQNSLDAAANPSQPVKVRFAFTTANRDSIGLASFFEGLNPGLRDQANAEYYEAFLKPRGRVLAIEDFGTTGLTGDPELWKDPSREDKTQRFWSFWRSRGRGKRDAGRRGSWGLGKAVFTLSSEISTFFGQTIRSSDQQTLLMGFAELKVHNVLDERRDPYGYYGLKRSDGLTQPIRDREINELFALSLGISRTTEPGLSIVVPYCRDEITSTAVRSAVIREYYLPLLQNELTVDVQSDTASVVHINGTTVRDWVANEEDKDSNARAVISLAINYVDERSMNWLRIADQAPGTANIWHEGAVAPEIARSFRSLIERGEVARVRIPVNVVHKNGNSGISDMEVLLKATGAAGRGAPAFVREGLTITDIKPGELLGGVALVVVGEGDLGAFLRRAENPSHRKWSSDGLSRDYKEAAKTLRFVEYAPIQLWELVSHEDRDSQHISIADVFGLEIDEFGDKHPPERIKKPGDDIGPPQLPAVPRPPRYELIPTSNGFRIKGTGDGGGTRVGETLRVRVGYAVRTGNALKRWKSLDFTLDKAPISINGGGFETKIKQNNVLEFEITDIKFEVSVTGFDTNRDLEIQVK